MDPETVEALLILCKNALLVGVGCAVTLGSLWRMIVAAINYFQRKDRRAELMPPDEEGIIATSPAILKSYSIPKHGV